MNRSRTTDLQILAMIVMVGIAGLCAIYDYRKTAAHLADTLEIHAIKLRADGDHINQLRQAVDELRAAKIKWVEVDCSECKGTGKVTYGKEWPEQFRGTFTCSICGGCGKLMEERL